MHSRHSESVISFEELWTLVKLNLSDDLTPKSEYYRAKIVKRCQHCKHSMGAVYFNRKYHSECGKKVMDDRNKLWRENNIDLKKAYDSVYKVKNNDKINARMKEYYAKTADVRRAYRKAYYSKKVKSAVMIREDLA